MNNELINALALKNPVNKRDGRNSRPEKMLKSFGQEILLPKQVELGTACDRLALGELGVFFFRNVNFSIALQDNFGRVTG